MSHPLIVRGIGELLTLQSAAKKDGRKVLERDLSIYKKAALVIQQGRIQWIGEEKKLPRLKKAKEISLDGACVLPAFIEAHTHLLFAGSRSRDFEKLQTGSTYAEIAAQGGGILSTMRATRSISANKMRVLLQARLHEFLRQGVSTVEVKTGYGLDEKSELGQLRLLQKIKSPMKIVPTFLGAHALPPEFSTTKDYIDYLLLKVLPVVQKKKLAHAVDIFVENGFFSSDLAEVYLRQAQRLGLALHIHADQLNQSGGTQLAVNKKALSAAHVLQVDDHQIRRLASSSVTAVLLPLADLYMKCSYPRARAMIEAGVRVALATDFNPGTAPSQDLTLVGLLARLEMKMSLPEVICAYTYAAASALGLASECGYLEVGKRADFISIEADWDQLFYSAGHSPVIETWIAGKCCFRRSI